MIVWLSCLYMYLPVNRDLHIHTHKEKESSIFEEKGADEQRSLLTGAEKCASGVDSEVAARMGNGALRRSRLRRVPGESKSKQIVCVKVNH